MHPWYMHNDSAFHFIFLVLSHWAKLPKNPKGDWKRVKVRKKKNLPSHLVSTVSSPRQVLGTTLSPDATLALAVKVDKSWDRPQKFRFCSCPLPVWCHCYWEENCRAKENGDGILKISPSCDSLCTWDNPDRLEALFYSFPFNGA